MWALGVGIILCAVAYAAAPPLATNELGELTLTNRYGDLNDDGYVDVRDVVVLTRHLNGTQSLGAALLSRADLNLDSAVTAGDRAALVMLIARRLVRAEEDLDGDELANAEELRLGTNPLDPDTDDDGNLDGWEVMEATDPLDPTSRVFQTIVAMPPVTVLHPFIQDSDTNAPGPVVARPLVQILHPLIQDTDTNAPGPVVALPPVEVLSPALQDGEEAGAITVARPSVMLLHPLIQNTDTNSTGTVVARPPTSVLNPTP